MNLRAWLRPGLGVKRWLLVVFIGELGLALAGALALRQVYRDVSVDGPLQAAISVVTLQFLPYAARAVILGVAGVGLFLAGSLLLIRALMDPYRNGGDQPLVQVIYQKRFLARGPRVVAIGGGTGLSTLLRGLKEHTSNITAIVTVADDGGSSGMLRETLGIPPVGDIRNCIVALADQEPLMAELLQYRFPDDSRVPVAGSTQAPGPTQAMGATQDGGSTQAPGSTQAAAAGSPLVAVAGSTQDAGSTQVAGSTQTVEPIAASAESGRADRLAGHAVGNLLIAAMCAVEGGDFEEGVRQMNRVLAVRGQVLPASPSPITLHARLIDGREITGQSAISHTSGIDRVSISPEGVEPSDDALRAIADADVIVLGPGSLFTSILPSLLIPKIRDAIASSPALKIYVCNVATQSEETLQFDLTDHVEALIRHTGPGIVDAVLANNRFDAQVPEGWHAEPVRLSWPPALTPAPRLVLEDMVDPTNAHHHDAARLAAAVMRYVEREGGARRGAGLVARSA